MITAPRAGTSFTRQSSALRTFAELPEVLIGIDARLMAVLPEQLQGVRPHRGDRQELVHPRLQHREKAGRFTAVAVLLA